MSSNSPVDPRVRLAITTWPPDAPRGAVSTFCLEHGISRETFYAIRRRVEAEGSVAALTPRSRRPKKSPTKLTEAVKEEAIRVRAALEQSGMDAGPISVFDMMTDLGMVPVPSIASLARIFRAAGVARLEPDKKPRSAYRRFVYPAPNACWQLDATEYVLAGGRTCVIFQLEDDHSRYAIASHVARSENATDAIAVMKKGIEAHGVPERLLTDNGAALNPTRRGLFGQLVGYVTVLGVTPITGRPYKPTTQGKNERFHQTLFRWLNKQPIAETIEQLQAMVDEFDVIYNTRRHHQALPDRMTPAQAYAATPKTAPPTPRPDAGFHTLQVRANGNIRVRGVAFQIDSRRAGEPVHVLDTITEILITDTAGVILAHHPWPPEDVRYVSNGHPRGPRKPTTVSDVLRHQPSAMS